MGANELVCPNSGVLGESLTVSHKKWVGEAIFEKYWTKPTKRKGVLIEEPNNPPKDSMIKLGPCSIHVEPHIFQCIMYGVKGQDLKPPQPSTTTRPVIQYGPPGGVLPPPLPPKQPTPATPSPAETVVSTPTPAPAQLATPATDPTPAPTQAQPQPSTQPPAAPSQPVQAPTQPQVPQSQAPIPTPPLTQAASRTAPPPAAPYMAPRLPIASPRGMESVLNNPIPPPRPSVAAPPPVAHPGPPPTVQGPQPIPTNRTQAGSTPAPPANPANPAARPAGAPAKPAGTDPIILTLAEKAGEDPHLRDLMKRVAQGDAAKPELERFQAIIDAITAESKRKGAAAGPAADRLLVDGRTVRYFADEVRAILDIVLQSNPNQTSADLRPPVGSDPLVVGLVKAALDDIKTAEIVRRIANNKPLFSDATELKVILDRLRNKLIKEKEAQQQKAPPSLPSPAAASTKSTGTPNGNAVAAAPPQPAPVQQGLRSKGPPRVDPKSNISAVVLEFVNGSGDRFLFPKFSVVEEVPLPNGQPGQQMLASFLIVRKGSKSEYPVADPELDYYQPVTIRLVSATGRHLDHLSKVVAPVEEVRRYMDDIMDSMTRAEYILLAMRLPRGEVRDAEATEESEKEKDKEKEKEGEKDKLKEQTNGAKRDEPSLMAQKGTGPQPISVLWGTSKATRPETKELPSKSRGYGHLMDVDDQRYQNFISVVRGKDSEE